MTAIPITSEGGGDLRVESAVLDGHAVLRLSGELDVNTAERFSEAARLVHAQGIPSLLVDVSELDFVDSTGLREFVLAHERQREIGGDIVLRAPSDKVRRVFDIVGLAQILTIT